MNRLRHWLVCLCPALFLLARPAHAATVVWADGFETNAASRWEITAGVWKLMNPTVGPPLNSTDHRTHTGTNCACTQGYGYSKDSRLICTRYNGATSLLVPTNSPSPRLRFWHWFNFGNALGYVEISTNNGFAWIQISPTYLNLNGGGVWSRPSLDLSPYAGQKILIAFHFTSGGCCGNGLGWFVDDVEVDTGPEQLNFPEGFEFDPKQSDWSVDFGTWEIGWPNSGPFSPYDGTNCAGTVLDGSYLNNVDTRLISPPFVVPASAMLNYWQWYSFNNAKGFVELNNGTAVSTSVTNITIITNSAPGTLNTNIYQLFGALVPGYDTNFYWNPTINGWTNGTKAMGSVYDANVGNFVFESGNAPLITVGIAGNVDYSLPGFPPIPLSTTPTNFIVWQGATWISPIDGSDQPVGFFATNSGSATYTTNTTITVTTTTWVPISPTFGNGSSAGNWTNVWLDLSAYSGQAVQIAFHFTSGGINTAAGWYVDDLSLAAPPTLTVPDDQVINAGDTLMVTNTAFNSLLPNAQYTFRLLSAPPHVSIKNGVVTWQTSPDQPSSTNTITVVATDNNVPPFSATNSFTVTVVNPFVLTMPPAQTIYAGQTMSVTISAVNNLSDSDTFTYMLLSPLLPNMDDSDLQVDGNLNWPTAITQPAGRYTIIIGATDDDFPYGATNSFTVTITKTPPPVLTVPATQTIYAGQTLTVTNQASSAAFPDGPFEFTLLSDPTGIDESDFPSDGVLAWMSYPTNKTSSKTITLMVTDLQSGFSATNSFRVNILPTPGPTLIVPVTQTNYAGMTLTVTNYATNVALSDAVFSFRLLKPSTNVSMTADGVLTWTNTGVKNGLLIWTNNSISPGTQVITLAADTLGYPPGLVPVSVTNHFDIVFVPPHPPSVMVPTNMEVYVGQTLAVTYVATNNYVLLTNVSYTFKELGSNVLLTSQGAMTWTNTAARPGVYGVLVKVTDNNLPPLSATNNSVVAVLPFPSQLTLTNVGIPVNGGHAFAFGISTPWTNTPWRIIATTNLATGTNWLPVYTNQNGPVGAIMFTDRLSTNFLQRYYRAVFP